MAGDPDDVGELRISVALCVFVTGAFAGALLTALLRLTPADWYYWVGLRILWQLGGALWFGYELGRELVSWQQYSSKAFWKSVAGGAVLGAALCINPLLDVVRGPLVVEGAVVGERYARGVGFRSIRLHVVIESADGMRYEASPWGRQANIYGRMMGNCGSTKSGRRFVILRRLGVFLSVGCRNEADGEAVSSSTADAPLNKEMNPAGDATAVMYTAGPVLRAAPALRRRADSV